MRKLTFALAALAGSAMLAGCSGLGGIVSRERPDEFAVQRQAPLMIPPDFKLVPPAPGAPRPTEGTAAQQALDALFGGRQQSSAIEQTTLRRAGVAEPGIRTTVGDSETYGVDKGTTTRTILAAPEGDGQNARAAIPG